MSLVLGLSVLVIAIAVVVNPVASFSYCPPTRSSRLSLQRSLSSQRGFKGFAPRKVPVPGVDEEPSRGPAIPNHAGSTIDLIGDDDDNDDDDDDDCDVSDDDLERQR
jgi:hypothetical protein